MNTLFYLNGMPLEACKGTLEHRILPAFVEKLSKMGKKRFLFNQNLHKYSQNGFFVNF